MKYVLVEIINGKIHGIYGGRNEKYSDVINYICSVDFQNCHYKFSSIEKELETRNHLNNAGYSFEIIIVI